MLRVEGRHLLRHTAGSKLFEFRQPLSWMGDHYKGRSGGIDGEVGDGVLGRHQGLATKGMHLLRCGDVHSRDIWLDTNSCLPVVE